MSQSKFRPESNQTRLDLSIASRCSKSIEVKQSFLQRMGKKFSFHREANCDTFPHFCFVKTVENHVYFFLQNYALLCVGLITILSTLLEYMYCFTMLKRLQDVCTSAKQCKCKSFLLKTEGTFFFCIKLSCRY